MGIILTIIFVSSAAVGCSGKKSHADEACISIVDFSSNDLLISGNYDEMIQRMGRPLKQFEQEFVKKDKSGKNMPISIPMIHYNGATYCQRGDSVQLVFIDLRKRGGQLKLELGDGASLSLDSSTLCDTFYDYMDAQFYREDHLKAIPDEEKLSFDPHYNVDGLYYVIAFSCNNDTDSPAYITPVFLPQTRQLWYIEFSPFDSKGLYRKIVK